MDLNYLQKFLKKLLSKVDHPRVGTVIALQDEVGRVSKNIMDIEIYGTLSDKNKIGKSCSGVLFSIIDVCNAYGINLEKHSEKRIGEIRSKVKEWEEEHGQELKFRRHCFNIQNNGKREAE